jgi:serine/threonine protein kinase
MAAGLAAGTLFGQYEIYGVAGRGGMGVVYRARQLRLERDVALKVISQEIAGGPDFRERFARESRLAAAIDHPHVVSVYDAGEDDGELYIAMQWIEGSDLRMLLDEGGELPPRRAVTIAAQIADALEAAHRKGLVHRDVKPGNILVRRIGGHDHAYLTDFGVARPLEAASSLTRTGQVLGTAGYLAPEQIRGETGDHRCDIYALGCVLFEMLTGEQPFTAENEMALRWAHASDPRPAPSECRPELGERFDAVVIQAMAIDPAERFQSGADLAKALEASARGGRLGRSLTAATHKLPRGMAAPGRGYQPTAAEPATPLPADRYRKPPPGTPQPLARRSHAKTFGTALLATLAVTGIAVGGFAASGGFSGGSDHSRHVAASRRGAPNPGQSGATHGTPPATQNGVSKPVGPTSSSSGNSQPQPVSYMNYSGPGYNAQVPTGADWAAPAQSEPSPGRLYRTSVRGPNGLFAIIDYTPNEKAQFGNYPYQSRTEVGQTAIGSATRYVFTGGKLPECQRSTCVDYIMNDPASGHGFGVLAGGGDFAAASSIARTMAESLTPSG